MNWNLFVPSELARLHIFLSERFFYSSASFIDIHRTQKCLVAIMDHLMLMFIG